MVVPRLVVDSRKQVPLRRHEEGLGGHGEEFLDGFGAASLPQSFKLLPGLALPPDVGIVKKFWGVVTGPDGAPLESAEVTYTHEEQLLEFGVLDYLAERESVREESLRNATRVTRALLAGMVRKKWIVREDLSGAQDAARTIKVAVLLSGEPDGAAREDTVAAELRSARTGGGARPHVVQGQGQI